MVYTDVLAGSVAIRRVSEVTQEQPVEGKELEAGLEREASNTENTCRFESCSHRWLQTHREKPDQFIQILVATL